MNCKVACSWFACRQRVRRSVPACKRATLSLPWGVKGFTRKRISTGGSGAEPPPAATFRCASCRASTCARSKSTRWTVSSTSGKSRPTDPGNANGCGKISRFAHLPEDTETARVRRRRRASCRASRPSRPPLTLPARNIHPRRCRDASLRPHDFRQRFPALPRPASHGQADPALVRGFIDGLDDLPRFFPDDLVAGLRLCGLGRAPPFTALAVHPACPVAPFELRRAAYYSRRTMEADRDGESIAADPGAARRQHRIALSAV